MPPSLLGSIWLRGTALLLTMVVLGFLTAVAVQSPLPPIGYTRPLAPAENLLLRHQTQGKLRATQAILTITQERLEHTTVSPKEVDPHLQASMELARGIYLQSLSEFRNNLLIESLTHSLNAISEAQRLYETLATTPTP